MEAEIWRNVDGCDGLYQVSNFGRVKSFHKGERVLKPWLGTNGYLHVNLGQNNCASVHRLVAQAFISNPDGKPQVNHINGIKTDNRVENLEWVTNAENRRHAFATGLQKQGEEHCNAKLTNEQVAFIRDNPDNSTCTELARKLGVSPITISQIQRGKIFKSAGGQIRTEKLSDPKRIPDNLREQIRAEYKRGVCGHGYLTLAKKFGVTSTTIRRIVHEK